MTNLRALQIPYLLQRWAHRKSGRVVRIEGTSPARIEYRYIGSRNVVFLNRERFGRLFKYVGG